MEKAIAHRLLSKIRSGGLKVTYWDGSTEFYGSGKPTLHIKIKSSKVFRDISRKFSLGFGEAYTKGDIEVTGPLDQLIQLTSANERAFGKLANLKGLRALRPYERNRHSNQKKHIAHHYDIGNDFYKLWLDRSMTYSCAYFKNPNDSLEKAQKQKLDHLLRKLQLEKSQTMLDIGSGWGALAIKAAKEYGVKVTGISLSEEQVKHSQAAAKRAGVDKLVKFELKNYQDLAKEGAKFDRIISVGMYEHVGRKNQKQYFKAIDKMLKPGALSVLHTISHEHETKGDPWIHKYIFPGGYIPSVREVVSEFPNYDMSLVDFENLRIHYAMTLDKWRSRFNANKPEVEKMFDKDFYRMWDLYLATSSGSFRYGDLGLSQFVFTKGLNNKLPLTREFLYK